MTPIALRTPSDSGLLGRHSVHYITLNKPYVSITHTPPDLRNSSPTSQTMSSLNGTAGSPSISTQLSREMSQQELDAAQQLIEHSQSIPRRHSPGSAQGGDQHMQDARRSGEEGENGVQSQEHHDLSDSVSMYQRPHPYPSAPLLQDNDMTPGQRRQQSNPSTPGGQMCRYALYLKIRQNFTDPPQQLRNNTNPTLETLSSRRGDLQRLWTLLQSEEPNATGRIEERRCCYESAI